MGNLWKYKEAAEFLGCSVRHVKRLVKQGNIPHKRIGDGKLVRFSPERLMEWASEEPSDTAPKTDEPRTVNGA